MTLSPLERLTAAGARLVQKAEGQQGPLAIRLKEIAATIRGSVASIRTALEGTERSPRHPKFALIVGDETPLPSVERGITHE
jgi:hypothetical protein